MKHAKYLVLTFFLFGSPFSAMAESVGCDDAFVNLSDDELVIDVAPTFSNDTANIQCALDAAVSKEIPIVRLRARKYRIGALMVENFKGTLEGISKTATVVEVQDKSIDCTAMRNSGQLPSAIKFVKGEPRIRFMTIKADAACISNDALNVILHFTGEPTGTANCSNDVIFGAVDRVILDGSSFEFGPFSAVEAAPEARSLGGCKSTLLGTFKLNRSTIQNIPAGIITSMRSGAQVDINFNEFHGNSQAINLFDTNQSTTITTNKFFGDNTYISDYVAIYVNNYTKTPPPKTRMVVHNNEFNLSSSFLKYWSYGVLLAFDVFGSENIITTVSSVFTNNRFNLDGANVYGLRVKDTSNAHVSANRFNGNGRRAIYVSGKIPITGWTITENTGFEIFTSFKPEDIRLSYNTSLFIVGPGQGASVRDDGQNNEVLPQ